MTHPRYELRARVHGASDTAIEVWQLPAPSTPHLRRPRRIAGLRGRTLGLVEHRIARDLRALGVDLSALRRGDSQAVPLDEDRALHLGLLFRALAPLRRRETIRAVVAGIEAMSREEAAYWLGMAMHRRRPRRVLTALRWLLDAP